MNEQTKPAPEGRVECLVGPEYVAAVNALLHQIDIGDFVDGHGHAAKMLKPVHDLMRLNTPPPKPISTGQIAMALEMADTNWRIEDGDAVNPTTGRARKAWRPEYVRQRVRDAIAELRSNSEANARLCRQGDAHEA
jgi:hypothetical protein